MCRYSDQSDARIRHVKKEKAVCPMLRNYQENEKVFKYCIENRH